MGFNMNKLFMAVLCLAFTTSCMKKLSEGDEDGVEVPNVGAEHLLAEIRPGVDEQTMVADAQVDGYPQALVAVID